MLSLIFVLAIRENTYTLPQQITLKTSILINVLFYSLKHRCIGCFVLYTHCSAINYPLEKK